MGLVLSILPAGPGNATNATHTGNNTANLTVEALVGVSDTHTLPASILGQPRNNSSLAEEAVSSVAQLKQHIH